MSPRKLRPYARMIQGMKVTQAQHQLSLSVGKAPGIILDVLNSAIANANHNSNILADDLKVSSILVNQGLVMKRFMPAAKGMAHPILKRTAHVTVVVSGDAQAKAVKEKKIQTVTADQFVAQEQRADKKEEQELTAQHLDKHDTDERSVETIANAQTGTAYQKMKMNQKGGNAKKTHRRKSIG